MYTVLIAEDDKVIRLTQKEFLEAEGYKVIEAADGPSLLKGAQGGRPDAILLDIMLGKDNGIALIEKVKTHTDVPIIVVSSKKDLVDRVLALEMGADDYMSKPVEMRELASRLKANIRRYTNDKKNAQGNGGPPLEFAGWVLDFQTYTVRRRDGTDAGLTTAEFNLLATLARTPNVVFSRERLFDLLQPDNYESFDRAIDIHIARIRKKLGDNARNPKIIKTVRNIGYIFIAGGE